MWRTYIPRARNRNRTRTRLAFLRASVHTQETKMQTHARTQGGQHATSPGKAGASSPRVLTPSAARAAVAIARRNYDAAKDAETRAITARRLAAAELSQATADAVAANAAQAIDSGVEL